MSSDTSAITQPSTSTDRLPSTASPPPASATAPPTTTSAAATTTVNNTLAPRALKKEPNRNYATQPPSWSISPPSASSRMQLDVYKGDDPSAAATVLERLRVGKRAVHSFGRNADVCTHALDHSSISRQHALIAHTGSGPHIVDLHSSQGTTVNGQRLEAGVPQRLYDDDVVVFGGSSRRYKVSGSGSTRHTPYNAAPSHKRARDDEKDANGGSEHGGGSKRHAPVAGEAPKIRASHLLIKHAASRRPSSHKTAVITRTAEEARAQLTALRAQLVERTTGGGGDLAEVFAEMCRAESDCSSYKAGGDLGRFSADKMQRAFSQAAFALQVGELSEVVETDSGMHLILRTE